MGIGEATGNCYATPYNYTKVDVSTSNDGWNGIATGIINGITSGLSDQLVDDISKMIFGVDDSPQFGDVITEVLSSQWPIIVFLSIGVIFCFITLGIAIGTCIWACTCRRSSKGIKSTCLNISGIVAAVISFAFIITGIIMYSISVDGAIQGVNIMPQQLHVILANVQSFSTGSTIQIECISSGGFDEIKKDIKVLPDNIIITFDKDTTLGAMKSFDYDGLKSGFDTSVPDSDKILADLKDESTKELKGEAKEQIDSAINIYQTLNGILANNVPQIKTQIDQINKTVVAVNEQVDYDVREAAKQPINAVIQSIDTVSDDIKNLILNINDAITSTTKTINDFLDQLQNFEDGLNEDFDFTTAASATLKVIIIIPCVIALIASLVSFIGGGVYAVKKRSPPSKGCCSVSCTLITLSIITLSVAWIVMLPSSLLMVMGYGTQLICQPFFYDPQFKIYTNVNKYLPTITIPPMDGGDPVPIVFSDILISCENEKTTTMEAIHADQLINITYITSVINVDDMKKQIADQIRKSEFEPINQEMLEDIEKIVKAINESLATADVPLDAAITADKPNVQPIQDEIDAFLESMAKTIQSAQELIDYGKQYPDSKAAQNDIIKVADEFIDKTYLDLTTQANEFMDDIIHKSSSCKPIYDSYEDLGHLTCEQVGSSVQGMWAGAGLAALFFIPAILAIFFVASALRGGKNQFHPSDMTPPATATDDPFQLPPITSTPPYSGGYQYPVAAPSSDPHIGGGVVVAAPFAAGQVSSDPWESSYPHPNVYTNPDHPREEFVDPLTVPVVYPRIKQSDRYYDNDKCTPPSSTATLSRF